MTNPFLSRPVRLPAATTFLLALLCFGLAATALRAATTEPLVIEAKAGAQTFAVEMAVTMEERSKGLMYRTELAPDHGMLFDFRVDAPVYMWMKNTYIPLDMVFIRADGRIAAIAQNTTPLSTETIASGGPVRAVLELPAGTVQAKGIAVGDRVVHRMFPKP
ncbi:DUF192 domain-containing protein [Ancylobacter terrae]|uniref:DUF192 domain-containing protein n=1 Tax=Ancylobacter sp. sgz301288 TaxID=3342077 RepID=UPI0038592AC0